MTTGNNVQPSDILGGVIAVLLIWLMLHLAGCKVQTIPTRTDSTRVEYRHDSIYLYERDSVFVDRYTKADTIFVEVRKWSIRYRDVVKEVRDTIVTKDVIVQPQPYIPDFHKNCTRGFWVLLVLIVGYIVLRIILRR